MKRVLLFFCFLVTFPGIISAHGFGTHMAHYPDILVLNDSYRAIIEHPKYKPYFLYGSIFPDLQYAAHYKDVLNNLYSEIRATKKWDITLFDGLTYEIKTDQIPEGHFPLGMDTHDDKYAMKFAEYMLTESQKLRSDVMKFGTGVDQKNIQLAFALGYYLHLASDVACHDFLVPSVTAKLNLGDIQLIKSQGAFAGEPNSQMEGIIEGICDHLYGDNNLVASTIYNDIWVAIGQIEPSVPTVIYDDLYSYPDSRYLGLTNPLFNFFVKTLNEFTSSVEPNARTQSTISLSGIIQLAHISRFVNQFYPSISGHGNLSYDLSTWVCNHLDYSDEANAIGIATGPALLDRTGICPLGAAIIAAMYEEVLLQLNISCFNDWFFYNTISEQLTPRLASSDARTLVSLMLYNIGKADELVNNNSNLIDINEYNKLKSSVLFTSAGVRRFLDPIWEENRSLGTYIYRWIGPSAPASGIPDGRNWYSKWSPWHSQSMAWGALSSFNRLIPDIYSSNPDIGVYDAYFEINGEKVLEQKAKSVFEANPIAKYTMELYNTTVVPQQNFTMRIRKDNVLNNYSSDVTVTQKNVSINDDPKGYGGKDRRQIVKSS